MLITPLPSFLYNSPFLFLTRKAVSIICCRALGRICGKAAQVELRRRKATFDSGSASGSPRCSDSPLEGSVEQLASDVLLSILGSKTGLTHLAGSHRGPASVEIQAYPHPQVIKSNRPLHFPVCRSHIKTFARIGGSPPCKDKKCKIITGHSFPASTVK